MCAHFVLCGICDIEVLSKENERKKCLTYLDVIVLMKIRVYNYMSVCIKKQSDTNAAVIYWLKFCWLMAHK